MFNFQISTTADTQVSFHLSNLQSQIRYELFIADILSMWMFLIVKRTKSPSYGDANKSPVIAARTVF